MPAAHTILLVCDDNAAADYLREKLIIDGGYAVSFEFGSQSGLGSFRQNHFDLVILKYGMTDMPTHDLFQGIKRIDPEAVVVVFVEHPTQEILSEIRRWGVYEVLLRPFEPAQLLFVIRKGIELCSLTAAAHRLAQSLQEQNLSLQKQNTLLAKRIEDSTRNLTRLYEDLRETYLRTIKALAQAIDARDHYTHSHSENVVRYAVIIAEELGLSAKDMELLRHACELHDLGKIGVDDRILTKPSSLTDIEWKEIKKHPLIGAQILEPLTFLGGVTEIIKQHHEHYDGSGYPDGLKGEDILLGARILHLADAYESMRSARSYRQVPLSKEEAVAEVSRNSGVQFDPKVVAAFLRAVDKMI